MLKIFYNDYRLPLISHPLDLKDQKGTKNDDGRQRFLKASLPICTDDAEQRVRSQFCAAFRQMLLLSRCPARASASSQSQPARTHWPGNRFSLFLRNTDAITRKRRFQHDVGEQKSRRWTCSVPVLSCTRVRRRNTPDAAFRSRSKT